MSEEQATSGAPPERAWVGTIQPSVANRERNKVMNENGNILTRNLRDGRYEVDFI